MSRIDYSKWDHFQDSDDEEEQDTDAPHVTRLDQPSRITTTQGQEGFTVLSEEKKKQAAAAASAVKANSSTDLPEAWTEKGGVAELPEATIHWTQDRYSVTMRVVAPEHISFCVKVEGILPYVDRNCAATTASSPRLVVSRKDKKSASEQTVWFQGDLPHAVHLAQDEEEDVDWTVERINGVPCLTLTLYKATPMVGVFVWWKRPLVQCPEIEWRSETDANSSFQQAWEEAHEQFKTNVANKKKTII